VSTLRPRGVLAAGAVALACATGAEAATLTVRVTSVTLSVRPTDRAPAGTSRGDTIVYRNRLLNAVRQFGRPAGAVVGSDRGTITFTGAHSARYAGTAVLPGGTLELAGRVIALTGSRIAIPVAGGTGRYAGALGYVVVGPGKQRALNVYTLTLPGVPPA
jgi:hypothetical protein